MLHIYIYDISRLRVNGDVQLIDHPIIKIPVLCAFGYHHNRERIYITELKINRNNRFRSSLFILKVVINGSLKCLLLSTVTVLTYLLTPWSRVLLEKLTSKLCS